VKAILMKKAAQSETIVNGWKRETFAIELPSLLHASDSSLKAIAWTTHTVIGHLKHSLVTEPINLFLATNILLKMAVSMKVKAAHGFLNKKSAVTKELC